MVLLAPRLASPLALIAPQRSIHSLLFVAAREPLESLADVGGDTKHQLLPFFLELENPPIGEVEQVGSGRLIDDIVQVLVFFDRVSPPRRFDRLDDQCGLAVVEQIERPDRRFSLPDLGRLPVDVGRQFAERSDDHVGLGDDEVRKIVVVGLGVEE